MKKLKSCRKFLRIQVMILQILCAGLCCMQTACTDGSRESAVQTEAREDLPPVEMVAFFFDCIMRLDVESMCPYMTGGLLEKMNKSLPQIQSIKTAFDKRDLYDYLVAAGAEPKVADELAKRIRDQKQEAVFWKGIEDKMKQFNPLNIIMQEKIDDSDGKSAVVSWSFRTDAAGAKPEALHFIRQDDNLWYWVSFADYAAFRQKSGKELTDAEKKAEADVSEDPFSLFAGAKSE